MSRKTIGTCGKCGGKVSVSEETKTNGRPTCEDCGAYMKAPHGPIVEMEESPSTLQILNESEDQ